VAFALPVCKFLSGTSTIEMYCVENQICVIFGAHTHRVQDPKGPEKCIIWPSLTVLIKCLSFIFKYCDGHIFTLISFQVEAALTTDPENEELMKLKTDLLVRLTVTLSCRENVIRLP
jgi:hypothetical protein